MDSVRLTGERGESGGAEGLKKCASEEDGISSLGKGVGGFAARCVDPSGPVLRKKSARSVVGVFFTGLPWTCGYSQQTEHPDK